MSLEIKVIGFFKSLGVQIERSQLKPYNLEPHYCGGPDDVDIPYFSDAV